MGYRIYSDTLQFVPIYGEVPFPCNSIYLDSSTKYSNLRITYDPVNLYRIKNRWKTSQYLHIENGYIQSGTIHPAWWSAQWILEQVEDTQYVRIKNRWKPYQYLHIEYDKIQSGPIHSWWWSAQWILEHP